jgi:hypothetical protein
MTEAAGDMRVAPETWTHRDRYPLQRLCLGEVEAHLTPDGIAFQK